MARPKLNKALLSLEVCLFVRGGASGGGALNTHDFFFFSAPAGILAKDSIVDSQGEQRPFVFFWGEVKIIALM